MPAQPLADRGGGGGGKNDRRVDIADITAQNMGHGPSPDYVTVRGRRPPRGAAVAAAPASWLPAAVLLHGCLPVARAPLLLRHPLTLPYLLPLAGVCLGELHQG